MGEKETMTGEELREAGSGMATGRAATPREAGSGMATGRAATPREGGGQAQAGISHDDTWESPAGVATGDLDGDGAAEAVKLNSSKSNRVATGDVSGDGSDDLAIGDPGVNGNIVGAPGGDDPAGLNTSHQNIKRDAAGGAGIAIDEPGVHAPAAMRPGDPIPDIDVSNSPTPEETAIIKSKSNITNNRVESPGGGGGAAESTTVKSSKSNTSD